MPPSSVTPRVGVGRYGPGAASAKATAASIVRARVARRGPRRPRHRSRRGRKATPAASRSGRGWCARTRPRRWSVGDRLAGAVALVAVGPGLEERRGLRPPAPVGGPRGPRDGPPDVLSVDGFGVDPEAGGAIDDGGTGRHVHARGLDRVQVVLADDDEAAASRRRRGSRLPGAAGVDAAVADIPDRDLARFANLGAERGAEGDADARTDDPVAADEAARSRPRASTAAAAVGSAARPNSSAIRSSPGCPSRGRGGGCGGCPRRGRPVGGPGSPYRDSPLAEREVGRRRRSGRQCERIAA